jgi:hypothetical protein
MEKVLAFIIYLIGLGIFAWGVWLLVATLVLL